MTRHLFFFIGLALLFTHELDAIRRKEWRMFVILSGLGEERAFRIFTALHIPIFFLIFLAVFGTLGSELRDNTIIGLDAFFVVHVVLHILFLKHPDYAFHAGFSRLLILGAGVCGILDFVFHL
jgi:hypothetical protein